MRVFGRRAVHMSNLQVHRSSCSQTQADHDELLYNSVPGFLQLPLKAERLGPMETCLVQGGRTRNPWFTMGMGGEDHSLFVWHNERTILPSNSWIEVSHVGTPESGSHNNNDLESANYWTYYMPGTNFWMYTGRLLALHGHDDLLARYPMPQTGSRRTRARFLYEDPVALNYAFGQARLEGFDTVEFVYHADQGCGNNWMEVIFLNVSGNSVCPQGITTRTGESGDRLCDCVNLANTARCAQ